jgi:hypothetical protein
MASTLGHSSGPPQPPFPCFRQGHEIHLIHSKKPCYVGLIPQGLDLYLTTHNRSFCGPCRKITAFRPACIFCNVSAPPVGFPASSDTIPTTIPLTLSSVPDTSVLAPELNLSDPLAILASVLDDPTVIIQVIPHSAIRHVSNALDRTLKALNQDPKSLKAHARLLLFVPYVLAAKSQRKDKQSTLTIKEH